MQQILPAAFMARLWVQATFTSLVSSFAQNAAKAKEQEKIQQYLQIVWSAHSVREAHKGTARAVPEVGIHPGKHHSRKPCTSFSWTRWQHVSNWHVLGLEMGATRWLRGLGPCSHLQLLTGA